MSARVSLGTLPQIALDPPKKYRRRCQENAPPVSRETSNGRHLRATVATAGDLAVLTAKASKRHRRTPGEVSRSGAARLIV